MKDAPLPLPIPPEQSAVRLDGVGKGYGGRKVIEALSLDVTRGEFLAILGPSGSGKTTVMRLIGGFETPDTGRVLIDGRDVTRLPPERRPVNTVFQSYALFQHMTVLENVAFGPRMQGLGRAARRRKAGEMLDLVHLGAAAGRYPHELSGGMQQRVALARALAADPAVLLLDEPLGALDRKLREDMSRELRRVQAALGATFIYVTHDQEEAFGMADRLAVMRAGSFAQIGAPATVYDSPASGWVARFVGDANAFPARFIGRDGAQARLETAFGPLRAGHVPPDTRPGEALTALIRPEALALLPPDAPPDATDGIPARITDRVTVGANLRLRATTADGTAFEALLPRIPDMALTLAIGDAVRLALPPAALRAYRPDPELP